MDCGKECTAKFDRLRNVALHASELSYLEPQNHAICKVLYSKYIIEGATIRNHNCDSAAEVPSEVIP